MIRIMHEPFSSRPKLSDLGLPGIIIGIVTVIGLLVLAIYIIQYIYKDAVKRGINAEMWLLVLFIVPVISWIVYFIVRNTNNKIREDEK